jgi:hypothetical protein
MGYSKFYYALLDSEKVVILTYFNVTIYFEYELLTISLCILLTGFFN